MTSNHIDKPPHFVEPIMIIRRGYVYNKSPWPRKCVIHDSFVVLHIKSIGPRDQSLNVIYEALNPKVFESIKDLEFAYKVR